MRHVQGHDRTEDASFELNLAPMLDMLVVLITVLLVSFTTVKLGILDSLIPQPVTTAMEKDRNKTDREFSLSLAIKNGKELDLAVSEKGQKERHIQITPVKNNFDYNRLHAELVKLKQQHSDVFRLEINPSEEVSYNDIITVMDRVRNTAVGDPKILIRDEKLNKSVETNLLFPDVVFSNAVEG